MYKFSYSFLDKARAGESLPGLFDLFYRNMQGVADFTKPYADERDAWVDLIGRALKREQRRIVLIRLDGATVGFFMYYVSSGSFVMEEIQFEPEIQGKGAFRGLYSWLLPQFSGEISQVVAFTHPSNVKSQAILEHFEFKKIFDEQEPFCRHESDYSDFAARFKKKSGV